MFNIGLNSVQFNLDSGYCAVIQYSQNGLMSPMSEGEELQFYT
jgi:hypothetical protein